MNYKEMTSLDLPWIKLKNKSVLVTGANGMIASALVDCILQCNESLGLGVTVYALCRNREKGEKRFTEWLANPAFRLMVQDVIDPLPEGIEFDYMIHAASSAYPGAMNNTPVDIMKANFLGTLNMLEYCRLHPQCRFLFVSSSEVYGENFEGIPIFTEDMPGTVHFSRFRACYPESKRASETLAQSFKKQYGTDVVVVRPAFIYGKDIIDTNTRADVYFLRQVLNHEDIVMYSEGSQIRSYCYVKDCISGMLFALLKGESGEVYNIGDMNNAVTLREYAEKLAQKGGVKVIVDLTTKPQNTVFLKTTQLVLDTQKLQGLGWKVQYDLDAGIDDMLA